MALLLVEVVRDVRGVRRQRVTAQRFLDRASDQLGAGLIDHEIAPCEVAHPHRRRRVVEERLQALLALARDPLSSHHRRVCDDRGQTCAVGLHGALVGHVADDRHR
ncbi:MAG: hypothetical protein ABR992_01205 [Solirubrobacteraceae bacterium]